MIGNHENRNVAIVHRYFWPQNYPYATMLKDVVESFVNKGASVSVYTSSTGDVLESADRSGWAKSNKVNIKAVLLRGERQSSIIKKAVNAVYFGCWLLCNLSLGKHDVVMVATTPPVIVATLVSLISFIKKFKVVYHCQDIHPEGLFINQAIKSKVLYRFLLWLDTSNIKNAWRVIVLSDEMKKTLMSRGINGENIRVINNFIFHEAKPSESFVKYEQLGQKKKFRFVFAGSIGRFQNLELLLEAIAAFRNDDRLEFVFMGDGPVKTKLVDYAQQNDLTHVFFMSHVSIEKALEYLTSADVGVVSVSPGVTKVAYPSKSMMYFSVGLPVLAVVDDLSDLSTFIAQNDLGVSVSSEIERIEEGIQLMVNKLQKNYFSAERIAKVAKTNFGKDIILGKLSDVVIKGN